MMSLLRFDQVTLKRGGRLLFEGLELQIGPGEAVQLAGPNGSGKSSLIRLAAGLLHPEQGRVQVSRLALADDNLALDPELPLSRALRFWGGAVEAAMHALGIAELAEVPVRFLSSGQAKRAALARVVASGAPLWLLDEPTNALDSDGGDRLAAIARQHLAQGGGILAASHQVLIEEWPRLELGQ